MPPHNFPPIHISATFVAAYNGKKPSIMIQNPVDLTEDIGTYFVDGFSDLKDAISDVAKDRLYDLWFHKDQSHTYKFDDSAFSGGSITLDPKNVKRGRPTSSRLLLVVSSQSQL